MLPPVRVSFQPAVSQEAREAQAFFHLHRCSFHSLTVSLAQASMTEVAEGEEEGEPGLALLSPPRMLTVPSPERPDRSENFPLVVLATSLSQNRLLAITITITQAVHHFPKLGRQNPWGSERRAYRLFPCARQQSCRPS
jgi:hypothetical protein